jgi:hypothetical protein
LPPVVAPPSTPLPPMSSDGGSFLPMVSGMGGGSATPRRAGAGTGRSSVTPPGTAGAGADAVTAMRAAAPRWAGSGPDRA